MTSEDVVCLGITRAGPPGRGGKFDEQKRRGRNSRQKRRIDPDARDQGRNEMSVWILHCGRRGAGGEAKENSTP